MLFLIALALVMIALAATGLSFERSLGAGGRRPDHHRAGDPARSGEGLGYARALRRRRGRSSAPR